MSRLRTLPSGTQRSAGKRELLKQVAALGEFFARMLPGNKETFTPGIVEQDETPND